MRILLVDDDSQVRSMLNTFLTKKGFEVIEAGDGTVALEILEEEPVDVTITDILMPATDGIELVMKLRKSHPEVKIIAMSGRGNEVFLESSLGLGAHECLAKPFDMEDLLKSIQRVEECA